MVLLLNQERLTSLLKVNGIGKIILQPAQEIFLENYRTKGSNKVTTQLFISERFLPST
jgi:hypothetical protein